MKNLITAFLLIFSLNVFSAESFNCNFGGSHFFLKMTDDNKITLENKFQSFPCEKGTVLLPGTEIELPTLVCAGKFKKVTYYMNYLDEKTIILSTNIIFSRNVTCNKN